MNFLNVFEQRVGSLFGATTQGVTAPFSFKKLAKKAAREMEAETFVINGVDTAPALYTILISSEDDITMRPLYAPSTAFAKRRPASLARTPPLMAALAEPQARAPRRPGCVPSPSPSLRRHPSPTWRAAST